jgi:hypothetical protein
MVQKKEVGIYNYQPVTTIMDLIQEMQVLLY